MSVAILAQVFGLGRTTLPFGFKPIVPLCSPPQFPAFLQFYPLYWDRHW